MPFPRNHRTDENGFETLNTAFSLSLIPKNPYRQQSCLPRICLLAPKLIGLSAFLVIEYQVLQAEIITKQGSTSHSTPLTKCDLRQKSAIKGRPPFFCFYNGLLVLFLQCISYSTEIYPKPGKITTTKRNSTIQF